MASARKSVTIKEIPPKRPRGRPPGSRDRKPRVARRPSIRAIALALLVAHDTKAPIGPPIEELRGLLTASRATRAKPLTDIQKRFVALCWRPQGATGRELAEAAGWPSIAARTVLTQLAERHGYEVVEKPATKDRSISFRLKARREARPD